MSEGDTDQIRVRDKLFDCNDWEYTLAGHLIGSDWIFPEIGLDTIKKTQQTSLREHGESKSHPEVVLKYSGKRISISGFASRIDPDDIGDIEPSCPVSKRIVEVQKEHSWQSLQLGSRTENQS